MISTDYKLQIPEIKKKICKIAQKSQNSMWKILSGWKINNTRTLSTVCCSVLTRVSLHYYVTWIGGQNDTTTMMDRWSDTQQNGGGRNDAACTVETLHIITRHHFDTLTFLTTIKSSWTWNQNSVTENLLNQYNPKCFFFYHKGVIEGLTYIRKILRNSSWN